MNQMDMDQKELTKISFMNATAEKFGFYIKLCNMTERVKVFSDLFLHKRPKFQENFIYRKRKERESLER